MNLFKHKGFCFSSVFWIYGFQSPPAIKNKKHSARIYKEARFQNAFPYLFILTVSVQRWVWWSSFHTWEVVRFPPEHTGHCRFLAGACSGPCDLLNSSLTFLKTIVRVIFQQRENCASYISHAKMWSLASLRAHNCKELKPKLAPTCLSVLPYVEQSVAGQSLLLHLTPQAVDTWKSTIFFSWNCLLGCSPLVGTAIWNVFKYYLFFSRSEWVPTSTFS